MNEENAHLPAIGSPLTFPDGTVDAEGTECLIDAPVLAHEGDGVIVKHPDGSRRWVQQHWAPQPSEAAPSAPDAPQE